MTALLRAEHVGVKRAGQWLVADICLEVAAGRVMAVLGPNGAGKSTLIKVMAGEVPADVGAVFVGEQKIGDCPAGLLAAIRAVVPQSTNLAFPFTALEVVELGGSVPGFGLADKHISQVARAALGCVGLEALAGRPYTALSGGERQRVQFARALCQLDCAERPSGYSGILLLDEPTASLDLAHQLVVLEEARRRARQGAAVLAILHDINLAARYADDVLLMHQGAVVASGTPGQVFQDRLLSPTFNVTTRANRTPDDGTPFLLPQTMSS